MKTETIEYPCGNSLCKGFCAYSNTTHTADSTRPAIIIAHPWRGLDDFVRRKAKELAKLGYIAFAADVYGNGATATNDEVAASLMFPLFVNRALLRKRINAALDIIKNHPLVDKDRIGAIGFCFGGLTVIELLRSGADVKGVVSFHGVLGNSLGGHHADPISNANHIPGALLILHGNQDPLVTDADIKAIQEEFTHANVDWQMHIYSHAAHAFTNPFANDPSLGMAFNTKANKRSWQAMKNFFHEQFTTEHTNEC